MKTHTKQCESCNTYIKIKCFITLHPTPLEADLERLYCPVCSHLN